MEKEMQNKKVSKPLFKSVWEFLSHFFIEHWLQIVWFGCAAFMTYLAMLADWIKRYGPIAWGVVGLGTYLIIMIGYALYGKAREKIALSRLADERWKTVTINPLDGNFSKQRIKLSDFFHPFYKPIETAKFQDCEFLGPSNIIMIGCNLTHILFSNCQAVIVAENKPFIGVTVFKNCIFERCNFYHATFYLTKQHYIEMKKQTGGIELMKIISDGKAGDL